MTLPQGYDDWRLSGPDDECIGADLGELCNRYPEPDGDEPRGYRPRRCTGIMEEGEDGFVCDTCGAEADQ